MDKREVIFNFIKKTFNTRDFERYDEFTSEYDREEFDSEDKEIYTYENLMDINKKVLEEQNNNEIEFLFTLMKKINKKDIRLMDKDTTVEFQCSGFVYGFTRELIMFNER
jgi:hypothetical protein